ncbi:MAG TPA: RDD family protein [Usitatibacteraceae bacterium]|nr:RDD family protein [Usitatibacteraceae bacterium]
MALPANARVPSIASRLACLPYEGLLLLALLLIAAFPVAGLQGATLSGFPQFFFQIYLAAIVASYYAWFWTHGGQTLPMKTWHFKVTDSQGQPLTPVRALSRLAAATLFFGPACVGIVLVFFPQRVHPALTAWCFVPALATLLWARFDADRQFLHDRIAGTRLLSA